jgi:hypothetical protein
MTALASWYPVTPGNEPVVSDRPEPPEAQPPTAPAATMIVEMMPVRGRPPDFWFVMSGHPPFVAANCDRA